MVQSRSIPLSLNPNWPHFTSLACIALALLLGLTRLAILDLSDPLHCDALLNRGRWLDNGFKNWQPDGCMMHSYQSKDAEMCLQSRDVVFLGDSVARKLFFQFANVVDKGLATSPPDDAQKHADHHLRASFGSELYFHWDPFLNSTSLDEVLSGKDADEHPLGTPSFKRPSLLVLGSGLWYLRYANTSGGLPAWERNTEALLDRIYRSRRKPADEIIVLPIEDLVSYKLSDERATTMLPSDRDAMNSELFHRIHPPSAPFFSMFAPSPPETYVSLPLVFNDMLDPSQTEDGLHFSDPVVRTQANILLNLHCNDKLPKRFPLDKTCCRRYPWPSLLHFVVLVAAVSWGPCAWILSRRNEGRSLFSPPFIDEGQLPPLVLSGAVTVIYLADRSWLWLKEQKQFDPWAFGFLNIFFLVIGLATVKRADKDLGFLNREQTDEWKGWMQIAILIYHYYGASKISGIYNPIRVLVASYLFMTGYGHTTFYVKKADFGFLRVAQILVRLNLLTILLAYTMNADYISYYFAPLVSMWYLIIYATMAIGSQFNDRTAFLVFKLFASMALVTWFMSEPWLLETIFDFLSNFCAIHWSAKEWAFRVNLDLWIVYFGMFSALAFIKIREHRLTEHPHWHHAVNVAIGTSALVMIWYFGFELAQPDKFVYNTWHPYVSFLPVAAFVVLRNANPVLRSANSKAFAWIGRCSLETFIIQYHLWLAADTKGILIVIPWTRWRSLNMVVTAVMFVYISHYVAIATGEFTSWICGTSNSKKSLPTTAPSASASTSTNTPSRHDRDRASESVPLTTQGEPTQPKDETESAAMAGESSVERPPSPPATPRRWMDRLAEGSEAPQARGIPMRLWEGVGHRKEGWNLGVKAKLAMGLGVMWFLNVLWPAPV